MGHILRAVRPGLRREIRRCRRRAGQGSGGTAGSARPGPGIGQRGSAAVNRRATAVKRHSRAGANRPGIARFRNRVHKPGGHRDLHCGGIRYARTVRHRQGEGMGHVRGTVCKGLRRENWRCRVRVGQAIAGSVRPGPGIGQACARVMGRAAAVKINRPAGANLTVPTRNYRIRGHEPGDHRDRHRVGIGPALTVRHGQREDIGHGRIAGVQRLRREGRIHNGRIAQVHRAAGPSRRTVRLGPGIGHVSATAACRAAAAV